MNDGLLILGGGVTGLAAGLAARCPVFEMDAAPGGICQSYYVRSGDGKRLTVAPPDGEAYRFELGGGHWIFGGDPVVLQLIRRLGPVSGYARRASVYLRTLDRYVPYPLQHNLRGLGPALAARALAEMARGDGPARTMKEWLTRSFGPTLCELFFYPFHERYTAGLYDRIAPQDGYKSAVDLALATQGARAETPAAGYNVTFLYPRDGLDALTRALAARCDLRLEHRVTGIDPARREIAFADGTVARYGHLISTLPLDRVAVMAGVAVDGATDPHTSVLVLNLGARRGPRCPDAHWVYCADTASGFHRVGVYSNVEACFLPRSARDGVAWVSLYVERAYPGGTRPSEQEVAAYTRAALGELAAWGWIGEVAVVDPTWIDVAYTWAWPGSRWRAETLRALDAHGIYQVGRYGRWTFQGIAESIRDGLVAGASFARA